MIQNTIVHDKPLGNVKIILIGGGGGGGGGGKGFVRCGQNGTSTKVTMGDLEATAYGGFGGEIRGGAAGGPGGVDGEDQQLKAKGGETKEGEFGKGGDGVSCGGGGSGERLEVTWNRTEYTPIVITIGEGGNGADGGYGRGEKGGPGKVYFL